MKIPARIRFSSCNAVRSRFDPKRVGDALAFGKQKTLRMLASDLPTRGCRFEPIGSFEPKSRSQSSTTERKDSDAHDDEND